jgi:hypothetical protein
MRHTIPMETCALCQSRSGRRPTMADQYQCEHGHAHYDGDQLVGSPYEDGRHHAMAEHGFDWDVASWERWERSDYLNGYIDGLAEKVKA